jgi:transcriptional regulator with XRE-family HTH domain
MTPDALPNRVREWRNHRGLTLRDVASQLGVAHGSIARIERGAQSLSVEWMRRFAAIFGIDTADLLNLCDGGLSECERCAIATLRNLPEMNRKMLLSAIASQKHFVE